MFQNMKNAKSKVEKWKPRKEASICIECGKRYYAVRTWQKFHSPKCRFRYQTRKNREARKLLANPRSTPPISSPDNQ